MSSYEKLNSFLVNDLSQLKGADSSLEQTQAMLEDLLKDEDNKLFKQLDDLKFGSFARQLNQVKQNSSQPKHRKKGLSFNFIGGK